MLVKGKLCKKTSSKLERKQEFRHLEGKDFNLDRKYVDMHNISNISIPLNCMGDYINKKCTHPALG